MKKILLIAVVFCSYGVGNAIAQGCAGKAKAQAEKKECTSQSLNEDEKAMAIQVAASSENVTAKVCDKSGNVSFSRISKCETSGKESAEAVNFDPESKKFVNQSPSEVRKAEAKKTSGEGEKVKKKECSGSKSTSSVESNCAGKSKAKACCKSKGKASASSDNK